MSTYPILVVEHEAGCPSGWVGDWLGEAGARLDVRRPYDGDVLPDHLASHSGMLVLGGSMGANDDADHSWLAPTRQLVRLAVDEGTPVLGICLGHQLVTVALGGTVTPNPRGQQIGVLDVGWQDAAYDDALFAPLTAATRAVQWNNDIVTELPDGADVLAWTAAEEIQAARFAPCVWGVQWHPEVGAEIIAGWVEEDRDAATRRGVDIDRSLAEVAAAEDEMRRAWRGLATGFAGVTQARVTSW